MLSVPMASRKIYVEEPADRLYIAQSSQAGEGAKYVDSEAHADDLRSAAHRSGRSEWSGGAATRPLRPQWLYLQRLVSAEDG